MFLCILLHDARAILGRGVTNVVTSSVVVLGIKKPVSIVPVVVRLVQAVVGTLISEKETGSEEKEMEREEGENIYGSQVQTKEKTKYGEMSYARVVHVAAGRE